jgi:hypothetical protein
MGNGGWGRGVDLIQLGNGGGGMGRKTVAVGGQCTRNRSLGMERRKGLFGYLLPLLPDFEFVKFINLALKFSKFKLA